MQIAGGGWGSPSDPLVYKHTHLHIILTVNIFLACKSNLSFRERKIREDWWLEVGVGKQCLSLWGREPVRKQMHHRVHNFRTHHSRCSVVCCHFSKCCTFLYIPLNHWIVVTCRWGRNVILGAPEIEKIQTTNDNRSHYFWVINMSSGSDLFDNDTPYFTLVCLGSCLKFR